MQVERQLDIGSKNSSTATSGCIPVRWADFGQSPGSRTLRGSQPRSTVTL